VKLYAPHTETSDEIFNRSQDERDDGELEGHGPKMKKEDRRSGRVDEVNDLWPATQTVTTMTNNNDMPDGSSAK
jgi:hypothetical protein